MLPRFLRQKQKRQSNQSKLKDERVLYTQDVSPGTDQHVEQIGREVNQSASSLSSLWTRRSSKILDFFLILYPDGKKKNPLLAQFVQSIEGPAGAIDWHLILFQFVLFNIVEHLKDHIWFANIHIGLVKRPYFVRQQSHLGRTPAVCARIALVT